MANTPQRTPQRNPIVIVPTGRSNCAPRYGGAASKQHDMNDAVKAVYEITDHIRHREKTIEEHTQLKTAAKLEEKKQQEAGGKLGTLLASSFLAVLYIIVLRYFRIL